MTDTATKPKAKLPANSNAPAEPDAQPKSTDDGLTQSERFILAAREVETDDDPERFEERVRKLARPPSRTADPSSD